MIINYPQKKRLSLDEINTPLDSIEKIIQKIDDKNRQKRFVNIKVNFLLNLYNINSHDNYLVFYFSGSNFSFATLYQCITVS